MPPRQRSVWKRFRNLPGKDPYGKGFGKDQFGNPILGKGDYPRITNNVQKALTEEQLKDRKTVVLTRRRRRAGTEGNRDHDGDDDGRRERGITARQKHAYQSYDLTEALDSAKWSRKNRFDTESENEGGDGDKDSDSDRTERSNSTSRHRNPLA